MTAPARISRGQAVAGHVADIATAISRSAERFHGSDALLARALRDHASELIDAADLIDAPWRFEARQLLDRLDWRRDVTLGDLLKALRGWPGLGASPVPDEARKSIQRLLIETGFEGREAVEALLVEVAQ